MIEEKKDPGFEWGKKKGFGGKNREVIFYESFIYDGVAYTLNDSVYLYKDDEPEPFVGKIIKIWESGDRKKKVKVLWFFRPCEILNFLEGYEVRENELFLAAGEGLGLANVNPLEAIAGKCNVACILKDNRNPHPLDVDLQNADFVCYRFFDVGKHKILDKVEDKIAGFEVKNIFNNLNSQKLGDLSKLGLDEKEVSVKVTTSNEAAALSSEKNNQLLVEKLDGKCFDNVDSRDKTLPQEEEKENGVYTTSLAKQKSFAKLSHCSRDSLEMKENSKIGGNVSIDKTLLKSKTNLEMGGNDIVGIPDRQINKRLGESKVSEKEKSGISNAKITNNVKNRRNYDEDDDVKEVPSKKPKIDTMSVKHSDDKLPDRQINKQLGEGKAFEKEKYGASSARKTNNVQNRRHYYDNDDDDEKKVPSKKLKIDTMPAKLARDKLRKESSTTSLNLEHKLDYRVMEVTQRPDVDRSKWFMSMGWEERMKNAREQGKLVRLENLDPSLTSSEVQSIIWHGFEESCTAKMIQKTAYSSPLSGQAFVIFKKKEAAESVVRKLEEGCFLMSNGRPLLGNFELPCLSGKKPIFYGHHAIDQPRQRETKDALSTSHCSQPNNIEYDMALEWCLLQEREDKSWRRLYQRQGEELRKLKAKLKSKI
ncbi:protein ANTI-SILENCING 1 [Vicia villosa]|uniref:protein ANTI-SILENCING 1 n=1 Tax=Vicia villosa TaxID=3911 RepID=UPI00273AB679|nr:protein ANTI-SILENCING 1 [Vicia villosa]XP_058785107.1 protein ANTI-SILENCING 1 [Vicia villosa]XP_058785108.1 protein ANTI-SILENCING 1 [Vicia villosa]